MNEIELRCTKHRHMLDMHVRHCDMDTNVDDTIAKTPEEFASFFSSYMITALILEFLECQRVSWTSQTNKMCKLFLVLLSSSWHVAASMLKVEMIARLKRLGKLYAQNQT